MNTTHSTLRWKVTREGLNSVNIEHNDGQIRSVIAKLHDSMLCEEHGGTAEGNAVFIVACVNAIDRIAHGEFANNVTPHEQVAALRAIAQEVMASNADKLRFLGRALCHPPIGIFETHDDALKAARQLVEARWANWQEWAMHLACDYVIAFGN